MAAGFHRYSFNFSLPYNIPCSFEHANGHIRYTMKAVIDRPWRFDHESKIAFTVVSSYDLNARRHQCVSEVAMWKFAFSSTLQIIIIIIIIIIVLEDTARHHWIICSSLDRRGWRSERKFLLLLLLQHGLDKDTYQSTDDRVRSGTIDRDYGQPQ